MASTRPPGTYSRIGRRGGGSGGVAGIRPAWSGGRVPTQRWAASIRRRSRPNTAFSEPAGVPEAATLEEPLAQRVLRQARSGQLDEDRLLPGQDKRERDLTKKLDKLAAQDGWYTFVSAQAHAIATGKAPARRNAEIMGVRLFFVDGFFAYL